MKNSLRLTLGIDGRLLLWAEGTTHGTPIQERDILLIKGQTTLTYDTSRITVHGSVDRTNWFDLAEPSLFSVAPLLQQAGIISEEEENLLTVRYIRPLVRKG